MMRLRRPKEPMLIATRTCMFFHYELSEVLEQNRGAAISKVRHAVYAMLSDSGMTRNDIGDFCHRDHSTVSHGVRVFKQKYKNYNVLKRFVYEIEEEATQPEIVNDGELVRN